MELLAKARKEFKESTPTRQALEEMEYQKRIKEIKELIYSFDSDAFYFFVSSMLSKTSEEDIKREFLVSNFSIDVKGRFFLLFFEMQEDFLYYTEIKERVLEETEKEDEG